MGNAFAPDGFRYGVMFSDGSVREHWNGRTQRGHAEAYARMMRANYPGDHITLARRPPGGRWVRVV
jgi:hypothetical protein